jgi:hypothetical protein
MARRPRADLAPKVHHASTFEKSRAGEVLHKLIKGYSRGKESQGSGRLRKEAAACIGASLVSNTG